jgi:hypothetical protein
MEVNNMNIEKFWELIKRAKKSVTNFNIKDNPLGCSVSHELMQLNDNDLILWEQIREQYNDVGMYQAPRNPSLRDYGILYDLDSLARDILKKRHGYNPLENQIYIHCMGLAGAKTNLILPEFGLSHYERYHVNSCKESKPKITMTKEQFWAIIDHARDAANGILIECDSMGRHYGGMYEQLTNILSQLDTADIIRWDDILRAYLGLAFKRKLWAAAYIFNDGWCSEGNFMCFCCWIIAQGKDVFLNSLRNPDTLAYVNIRENESTHYRHLDFVTSRAFDIKHNSEDSHWQFNEVYRRKLPTLSNKERADIESEIVYADDIDLDLSDGNTLLELLPNLCRKYNWNGAKVYIFHPDDIIDDGDVFYSLSLPCDYIEDRLGSLMSLIPHSTNEFIADDVIRLRLNFGNGDIFINDYVICRDMVNNNLILIYSSKMLYRTAQGFISRLNNSDAFFHYIMEMNDKQNCTLFIDYMEGLSLEIHFDEDCIEQAKLNLNTMDTKEIVCKLLYSEDSPPFVEQLSRQIKKD